MSSVFLSLVVPAHNEEARLSGTLDRMRGYLETRDDRSEVLVVENGSRDRTAELAREYAERWPALRVLVETQAGKGRAVRRGMLEARGEWRLLCDADLSMPIEEVERLLPPRIGEADVAVGSREAPGSRRFDEGSLRHTSGRLYNALTRRLLPDIQDTQCGFKAFRGSVADDVFPRQTLTGYAFDVEALLIARRRGYRLVEVGIPWRADPDTRVSLWRDTLPMVADLWRIRQRARQGAYEGP